MGTYITEDFVVEAGEVRRYAMNGDNHWAAAFIVSDFDGIEGQVYFEPSIINYGELYLDSGGLIAGAFFHYSTALRWEDAVFENHGLIVADLPNGSTIRIVNANGPAPDMANYGTIILNSGSDADGFRIGNPGFNFHNGVGAVLDVDAGMRARGFNLYNGGSIVNHGEITAHVRGGSSFPDGETATAILSGFGNHAYFNLVNTGLIEATGTSDAQVIHGVSIFADGGFSIINSGTIQGSYSIFQRDLNRDPLGHGSIENSGLLAGHVTLAAGNDTIVNTGQIIGNVDLGAGNDTFLNLTGTFVGSLNAGDGVDRIQAGGGDHVIDGGSNVDTAIVSGSRSEYVVAQITLGVFEVSGPDGTDTLTNFEYLQFDDQTIRLVPGSGTAVNFETADPLVYQSAMENIRDFDGNALGGNGSWLRIGSADIDGDGDVDQILVNDAIGRFATVGGSDDGLAYFEDHGWAGETRVAGIYVDPLVQSGDVVAGSDSDSQRRFQNDLQIENINRVLGADDYDGDGLQEVYLALTDGTAYLHLYMHADGNIQYANYQSEQQVIDYLTANGFTAETWADWFPADAEPPSFKAAEPAATARPEPIADLPVLDMWGPDAISSGHVQLAEVFA